VLIPFVAPHQPRLPMWWHVGVHIEGHAIKGESVVHVEGDVDSASINDLCDTVQYLSRPSGSVVLVDLSGSPFVSARALRQLDDLVRHHTAGQRSIEICGLSHSARRVQDVARLHGLASAAPNAISDSRSSQQRLDVGDITVHCRGDAADVTLSGEFDLATDANLRAALDPVADGGPTHLRLDAGAVTFAASSTLSVVLWLHHRITCEGGSFEVTDVSPSLRRLLDLSDIVGVPAFGPTRQRTAS